MSTPDTPAQRTLRNPLRARLARLAQLGLVRTWAAPADSPQVTVHTTGGDTWTGTEQQTETYLDGLAHGSWARQSVGEIDWRARASASQAEVVHQPREHPVPCMGCHQPTDAVHAYCVPCMSRSPQMLLLGTCERCRVQL